MYRRILQSIALIIGVLVLVFFTVRLTGDPVGLMVARNATPEQREAFRVAHGFDRPLAEQFLGYLGNALGGDLGKSLRLHLPNTELIMQRLPATMELALAALALSLLIAVPLGIVSGVFPGSPLDLLARLIGLAGQTIPSFWLAMILILVFAVNLRLFPTFGRDSPQHLVLPAVALSVAGMGQMVRLLRSAVLEVCRENYIRTARAKGLSEVVITLRHVTPNALIPLVSVVGVNFTYMLGGSVYIETIFAWPGLGTLLNDAINDSDFPLVQAITIFIAAFAIGLNLLTDIAYDLIDPRARQR
ncbi:MAG: ABC transporter permease [Anaerolineaceae bacterium]|nr:ABC transporter permease [Anaerolineaceae bacterium]MDD9955949.1 ABC transporter permease [Anaerolineaceae bacterium]MDE0328503.1 ABC transporter permease [Anaerolineaceae bacterium]